MPRPSLEKRLRQALEGSEALDCAIARRLGISYVEFQDRPGVWLDLDRPLPHFSRDVNEPIKVLMNLGWDWGLIHQATWGYYAWLKSPSLRYWETERDYATPALALWAIILRTDAHKK